MTSLIHIVLFLSALTTTNLVFDVQGGLAIFEHICFELAHQEPESPKMTPEQGRAYLALCTSYGEGEALLRRAPIVGAAFDLMRGVAASWDERPPASVTVADAVTSSCSTGTVRGLSQQLIDELQCMEPGVMRSVSHIPNLEVDDVVFPYLQSTAVEALERAARKHPRSTMRVTSALRTLPQQYMLYTWYRKRRCRIRLAASPGRSKHELGLAIDTLDPYSWKRTLRREDFRWAGRRDPVHFSFSKVARDADGEPVDLRHLSVVAFQRLWNRNNPDDRLPVHGRFDRATAKRLARTPARGFAHGPRCDAPLLHHTPPAWIRTFARMMR